MRGGQAAPFSRPVRWRWIAAAALFLTVAVLSGVAALRYFTAPPRLGTIVIETTPVGGEVIVSGVSRGRAPLNLTVAPGEQTFTVVNGDERILVKAVVSSGATVTQHVVFAPGVPQVENTGSLRVTTQPVPLVVTVDGINEGLSPVTVRGLAQGPHRVRLASSSAGSTERVIQLGPGESMSLILTPAGAPEHAPPPAGWVAVASPIALRLLEGNQVVGTSEASRTMLSFGIHEVDLVNDELGFREHRRIQIAAGKITSLKVDVPRVPLHINAVPWADVTVDTEHVGETPIGNYTVAIGSHEVIFRHPVFGERRQQIKVGLNAPARVTVNFSKQ